MPEKEPREFIEGEGLDTTVDWAGFARFRDSVTSTQFIDAEDWFLQELVDRRLLSFFPKGHYALVGEGQGCWTKNVSFAYTTLFFFSRSSKRLCTSFFKREATPSGSSNEV